jgi:cell division protein FtsL
MSLLLTLKNKNMNGEYQEKLEIIQKLLGIEYLHISTLEFQRKVENLVDDIELKNNNIDNLESQIGDLEFKLRLIK